MDFEGFASPDGIDTLVGFGFDIDLVEFNPEPGSDVGAHQCFVWAQLGLFADDGRVEVDQGVAMLLDAFVGFFEEEPRVLGFVFGVVVGEELPDVWLADGAEEGIGDGVEEGVAIGVGDGGSIVGDFDASED